MQTRDTRSRAGAGNQTIPSAPISIGAARALMENRSADFALYLPGSSVTGPVLYRDTAANLSLPDFPRLRAAGAAFFIVLGEDYKKCLAVLEDAISELVTDDELTPGEKAVLLHQVGTNVARALMGGVVSTEAMDRGGRFVSATIDAVVAEPELPAHLVTLALHQHSPASHMMIVCALSVALGIEAFCSSPAVLVAADGKSEFSLPRPGPRCPGDRDRLTSPSQLSPGTRRDLAELGLAALVHDLGKLRIHPRILNKLAPLSPEELAVVYQHPVESVRLLGGNVTATPRVRQMILQHHEWVNGRGYPIGLTGPDLLPGSRVLAIVDGFHALLSRHSPHSRRTLVEAERVLAVQAGRQFDPDLLQRWRRVLTRCRFDSLADLPVPLTPSEPVLSVRHEHRPFRRWRKYFGPRSTRHACRAPVAISCVLASRLSDTATGPREFVAYVHDVSRSGLCLLCEHPLYRGEIVHVRLNQGSQNVWVRAQTVWCLPNERHVRGTWHQTGTKGFRIGVRFIGRIDESDAHVPVAVSDPMVVSHEGAAAVQESTQTAAAGVDQPGGTHQAAPLPRSGSGATEPGETAVSCPAALPTQPAMHPVALPESEAIRTLEAIAASRPDEHASRVPPSTRRMVVALASSPYPSVRRKAVDILAAIGSKEARSALLSRIKDADPSVREHAVAVAGMLKMDEAGFLLRELLSDVVVPVALQAAGALGRIGERSGLPLVKRHLEQSGPFQRLAARALGEIVGHRFPGNAEGVLAARRYMDAALCK